MKCKKEQREEAKDAKFPGFIIHDFFKHLIIIHVHRNIFLHSCLQPQLKKQNLSQ
jgi:hypothetical protein